MSHDDSVAKALERIEKLVLIAVQSNELEEARTAAHECCRLIHKHSLRVVASTEARHQTEQIPSGPGCRTCSDPVAFAHGQCVGCFMRDVMGGGAARQWRPKPAPHQHQAAGTSRRICRSCAGTIPWAHSTGLCDDCRRKKPYVACVLCGKSAPYGNSDEQARANAYAAGFRPVGGAPYCRECADQVYGR